LGLAALPIAYRAMRWLPDRGYAFSKALGLLITSYLVWLGAITRFLRNDSGGIFFAILGVFGISAILLLRGNHLSEFLNTLSQNRRVILIIEILFATAFVAWVILRAYAPDKVMNTGGEKFMEMAFLNGVLNSPRFPPLDPWLSGFAISYYYFGYIMMAILTRMSAAPAGIGFELYDALLFALTAIGAFGVVYNLVARSLVGRAIHGRHRSPLQEKAFSKRQPIFFGLIGTLFVVILGNLEGFFEVVRTRGLLSENFWRWIDIPGLADSPVTGGWIPPGGFFACCWRASRVLQDYDLLNRPMGISPITEFPMFSFLLGDNHPHVLALPFVIVLIALAFNLLLRQAESPSLPADQLEMSSWIDHLRRSLHRFFDGDWILLIFYAFCLGALGFLNTWDMPIYLGLLALAYGAGEIIRRRKIDLTLLMQVVVLSFSLLAGAILFYILFYLGFGSQAGGVLPYVFKPTRLPQYLVMFGVFIFILTWFLITAGIHQDRQDRQHRTWRSFLSTWGWILAGWAALLLLFTLGILLVAGSEQLENPAVQALLGGASISQSIFTFLQVRLANPWLMLLLTGMLSLALVNLSCRWQKNNTISEKSAPDGEDRESMGADSSLFFVLLLIILGLLLVMSVEILYLRDSFGVRMNTIFKFYYQAWVMFGLGSAYAVWWLLNPGATILRKAWRWVFLVTMSLLIVAALAYPLIGIYHRVDGFRNTPRLDGTANLALANPDDWAAINWLRENASGAPVILEAPGKSYNYEGRISAFTGYPALLGWAIHEAQWRGNYDEQGRRELDIETIYSTRSGNLALELLQKWGVKYVIVGATEMNYIQQICANANRACNLSQALSKFDAVLNPVFKSGNMTIYAVPGADR
jgi:YYY domain-containing protein